MINSKETDPNLPLDPETGQPVAHTGGSTHWDCWACELINSPYGAQYAKKDSLTPTQAQLETLHRVVLAWMVEVGCHHKECIYQNDEVSLQFGTLLERIGKIIGFPQGVITDD